MFRRALILVLCAGLFCLAPTPLAACGMLMELPAGCAPAKAKPEAQAPHSSHCAEMAEAENESAKLAAGASRECCQVQAPLPEGSNEGSKAEIKPAIEFESLQTNLKVVLIENGQTVMPDSWQDISPPDLQPLFCTFLI